MLEADLYIPREAKKVLLHGECALDESFQRILREAVEAVLYNKPGIFALDPVYSSVRGAAEMAKQVHWSYNHTMAA